MELYIRDTLHLTYAPLSAGRGGVFLGDASAGPKCRLTKTRWAGEENGGSGQREQHTQSSMTGEQRDWLEPRMEEEKSMRSERQDPDGWSF